MIDEKGRLFGKINLVDLLIIVIVLAAGTFLGYKLLGPQSDAANTREVVVSLYCEESADFVVDALEAGSEVWDASAGVTLGALEDWRTGYSNSYITSAAGEVIGLAREGYYSVSMTVRGTGVVGGHGVTIGGTLYALGHSMSVYAGDCKLFVRVSAIEVVD